MTVFSMVLLAVGGTESDSEAVARVPRRLERIQSLVSLEFRHRISPALGEPSVFIGWQGTALVVAFSNYRGGTAVDRELLDQLARLIPSLLEEGGVGVGLHRGEVALVSSVGGDAVPVGYEVDHAVSLAKLGRGVAVSRAAIDVARLFGDGVSLSNESVVEILRSSPEVVTELRWDGSAASKLLRSGGSWVGFSSGRMFPEMLKREKKIKKLIVVADYDEDVPESYWAIAEQLLSSVEDNGGCSVYLPDRGNRSTGAADDEAYVQDNELIHSKWHRMVVEGNTISGRRDKCGLFFSRNTLLRFAYFIDHQCVGGRIILFPGLWCGQGLTDSVLELRWDGGEQPPEFYQYFSKLADRIQDFGIKEI
ncbi:hypothetical protein [Endothiovibrio diazotrophicus]